MTTARFFNVNPVEGIVRRILVLLAVTAMPLAAQQPRTGHDEHEMARMEHMEGAMAFKPDQILAHRDSLNLTAAQISRLTSLQDAAKKAHEDCGAAAKPHMAAITEGLSATAPDTAALRQHIDAAHAAMGKGHWATLATAMQARALLSEDQRSRVERWASRKSEHREHH